MGHAQRLVHRDAERHRVGSQLPPRRPERMRRLARIAPMDPAVTQGAPTDRHVEAFPDRLPDDLLLILRLDLLEDEGPAARTSRRGGHRDFFVDPGRHQLAGTRPVGRTRLAARPLRMGGPNTSGKGRRLTLRRPLGLVQLLLQPCDGLLQPIPLTDQVLVLLLQPIGILLQPIRALAPLLAFLPQSLILVPATSPSGPKGGNRQFNVVNDDERPNPEPHLSGPSTP